MKKIKIFLASSNELKSEREQFEIEIYRKCKTWFDKGIFLHLDFWEDLSTETFCTSFDTSTMSYHNMPSDSNIDPPRIYQKLPYPWEKF